MSISTVAPPRPAAAAAAVPTAPTLGRAARFSAATASLLVIGATGVAVSSVAVAPSVGAAIADGAGAALGSALALMQGAHASDRRGRRRFVLSGLVLLGAALLAHVASIPFLAGLLLGIGAVMTVMAATGWLEDSGEPRDASAVLSLVVVAAAVSVETVSGRRTPVFVLPTRPHLSSRPVAAVVLAALAASFALRSGGVPALVALLVVLAVAITVGALRARRRVQSTPLADRGRSYDKAVAVFDATVALRPELAATVRSVDDVREAIESARARGLVVAMHTTGHAAAGLADLSGSALVKVAIDEPVTVDAERRTVRIPAGRAWGDVVPLVAAHGLAVPHGSSSRVGVVGYLTRGGLSAYGRHTGVAANAIESIELVTADGEHRRVDRDHDPELFWALRGGGGGFGVVTAVTVRAFVPGEIVTGTTIWEVSDAEAVAHAWAEWSAEAPSAITTSLRVLTIPPIPGMPFSLTRRPVLVVDGTAVDGDVRAREAAGEMLARLRAAATPRLATWRVADQNEVPHTHMDAPFAPAHSSAHALLGAASPSDADQAHGIVADFLRATTDSSVLISELRQLGGALAERPDGAGVVGHYRGAFGWLNLTLHGKPGRDAAEAAIDAQWAQVERWRTGYTAPTLASERHRAARSFPDGDIAGVDAVRARVDAEGLFRIDVAPGAHSRLI
ncbi:MAG: FAD-binding protein [Microbacterium sp.]|uniref:FAD-binding oxidoreductase n=1 Tax=Microbacterium sp. TaxID=51671 RepID=UPI00271C4DB8|nr:FAD-binding protein [Microbacterium sp.]MDO8382775.1 FAD-binding protein [Microbacterium sp.]